MSDDRRIEFSAKTVRSEGDPHAFCVTPGMLTEVQSLLDLRERQLVDCTRAMRGAAESIHKIACGARVSTSVALDLYRVHDMLRVLPLCKAPRAPVRAKETK